MRLEEDYEMQSVCEKKNVNGAGDPRSWWMKPPRSRHGVSASDPGTYSTSTSRQSNSRGSVDSISEPMPIIRTTVSQEQPEMCPKIKKKS